MLSLREAAELAGTSKSSILRAVKTGRLSATRNDQGEFKVDPAEVARVYDKGTASHRGRRAVVNQGDANHSASMDQGEPSQVAALAAEIKVLRELITRLDQDKTDLMRQRDGWQGQAERLALAPPSKRSWWSWRRSG